MGIRPTGRGRGERPPHPLRAQRDRATNFVTEVNTVPRKYFLDTERRTLIAALAFRPAYPTDSLLGLSVGGAADGGRPIRHRGRPSSRLLLGGPLRR